MKQTIPLLSSVLSNHLPLPHLSPIQSSSSPLLSPIQSSSSSSPLLSPIQSSSSSSPQSYPIVFFFLSSVLSNRRLLPLLSPLSNRLPLPLLSPLSNRLPLPLLYPIQSFCSSSPQSYPIVFFFFLSSVLSNRLPLLSPIQSSSSSPQSYPIVFNRHKARYRYSRSFFLGLVTPT